MTAVRGSIWWSEDATQPAKDVFAGYVINRSETIDAMLVEAGFDLNSINHIKTPLFGASRYCECTLLVATDFTQSGGENPLPQAAKFSGFDQRDRFTIVLAEPSGGGTGGGSTGGADDPGEQTGPNTGGGATPDDIETGTRGGAVANLASATAPSSGTIALTGGTNLGRAMRWRGMIHTSAFQLLADINGSTTIPRTPWQTNKALWVLKFADPRLSLQAQGVSFVSAEYGSDSKAGYLIDQWNMLADNPLHFVANTCKSSTTYEPDDQMASPIPLSKSGAINRADMIGVPCPDFWYEDEQWYADEILNYYVAKTQSKDAQVSLDRWPITYVYQQVVKIEEKRGDMWNLDLRGRSIGEALDEIAGRIGCVWKWDRYKMQLSLVKLDYGNDMSGQYLAGPTDGYRLSSWEYNNTAYRVGGGFSQITTELPQLLYGTVHQVRHVSCWGSTSGGQSRVFTDVRASQSTDGVRVPGDETSDRDTVLGASPRPPLYYQLNTSPYSGRVQFIGDHVPAFVGYESDGVGTAGTKGWFEDPAMASQVGPPPIPWNKKEGKSAYWAKEWPVTLEERLQVAVNRYKRAQFVIDGNVILNRLPAYAANSAMNQSPGSGFQWDEVYFGCGSKPLVYRMWGENTDPLIVPHLISTPRVKAYGLGSQYQANGFANFVSIPKRCGIVRSFLAKFKQQKVLKSDGNGRPYVWLYRFSEVFPDNLLDGSFAPGNEFGNSALGARGNAINLCEMNGNLSQAPVMNFDGGLLRYDAAATDTLIVRTAPEGVATCYEYAHPSGFTMYYLMAPNGVEVTCPTAQPFTAPNPAWQKSGASGIGDIAGPSIASMIQT
jgi:hypothetical protein